MNAEPQEPADNPAPTLEDAATAFAAQARKSALLPAKDGLEVFSELARATKAPAQR